MTVLSLHFCARAFPSCGKWGPLFIAVRRPLTTAASLAAEHRLQTRRLSNCGSRAQPLRGTRDPPRPGPEPVSPALAGRFPTTAPPGKPLNLVLSNLAASFDTFDHTCFLEHINFLAFSISHTISFPPVNSILLPCSFSSPRSLKIGVTLSSFLITLTHLVFSFNPMVLNKIIDS